MAYFIPILLFSSCFSIQLNLPGLKSGYKKLDQNAKNQIIFVKNGTPICNLKNDLKIYSINAEHLLNCLKENDTSVVYFWSPNCHGKNCISVSAAQRYCDSNHYKLYLISDYYDLEKLKPQNKTNLPVFSVNHKFYKSDFCNKYNGRFQRDLIPNEKANKKTDYFRFYFFYGDKLLKKKESIFNP